MAAQRKAHRTQGTGRRGGSETPRRAPADSGRPSAAPQANPSVPVLIQKGDTVARSPCTKPSPKDMTPRESGRGLA